MSKRNFFLILLVLVSVVAYAQTFFGKCVGVTDGDTISVLQDGKQVKVRLDGIDCPESGQDFGSKAKKFTSNLVYDKQVEVRQTDTDKYGRIVARVIVEGKDVSLELVRAGLAWHYKQYSNDTALANAEATARLKEEGLWALANPIAPWDFRHGTPPSETSTAQPTAKKQETQKKDVTVYITRTGAKYHRAGCQYLRKSMISISKKDAVARGYTPCSRCNP